MKMPMDERRRLLAYCGIYCGLCAKRSRIPQLARRLREAMEDEGWDKWYVDVEAYRESFPTFWSFLKRLEQNGCACREGGGPPGCRVRRCAMERGVEACPLCPEYPCEMIKVIAEHNPTLIHDGMRMRRIGIERWIEEQEERRRRGFVYTDIRIPWNYDEPSPIFDESEEEESERGED